ncbi:MAG: protease pro-enzyme activation domain-containing protein, partial [Verrucomicrobiota bacterium]
MSRIIQFAMKAASTGALVCICATAAGQQVLPGHVPEAISHLHSLGRLAATNEINLAISLPLRNQSELTSFLAQLYDPASTNFHKYLTPQEFTERFGPAAAEYEALKTFVQSNHFAVTGAFDNRLLLNVSGKVTEIEHTFHVTLNRFHHPTGARDFYAPDREPSVNTSVPLLRIYGLDNFDRPRCFARPQPIGGDFNGSSGSGGSVPGGYLRGKDFRNAYLPGVTLDGSGQMVGLVEFDGYYPSDIATYESQAGL